MAASTSSSDSQTAQWINNIIGEKSDDESLETYLASYAMKLHVLSQETTDQLETSTLETMLIIPRALAEINSLTESFKTIDNDRKKLQVQLQSFDKKNISGVDDLSKLDIIKQRMGKCRSILSEYAKWNTLVREARLFLEGGGRLADSADRIFVMCQSMELLSNLPGHDERAAVCKEISASLLSALEPKVKKEISEINDATLGGGSGGSIAASSSGSNLQAIKEYFEIFIKLGRKDELEAQYISARCEVMLRAWESCYVAVKNSVDNSEIAIKLLSDFYAKILSFLTEESVTIETIFGKAHIKVILLNILETLLRNIVPRNVDLILGSSLPSSNLLFHDLYAIINSFAKNIICHFDENSDKVFSHILTLTFQRLFDSYPQYFRKEEIALRFRLHDIIETIDFSANTTGSTVSTGLDLDTSDDSYDLLETFSRNLLLSCDEVAAPIHGACSRTFLYAGSSQLPVAINLVASAVGAYVKQVGARVADLRRLLLGGGAGESSNYLLFDAELLRAYGGSKALDRYREVMGDICGKREAAATPYSQRLAIPCALTAIQSVGRLARQLNELESELIELILQQPVLASAAAGGLVGVVAGGAQVLGAGTSHGPLYRRVLGAVASSSSLPHLSVGSVYANHLLQSDSAAMLELKSFLSNKTATVKLSRAKPASSAGKGGGSALVNCFTLFSSVNAPFAALGVAAGLLFFDICSVQPAKIVSDLYSDDSWVAAAPLRDGDNDILPQSSLTAVGEHMLSLVHDIESFASKVQGDECGVVDLVCLSYVVDAQSLVVRTRAFEALMEAVNGAAAEDCSEGLSQLLRQRTKCVETVLKAEKAFFGHTLVLDGDGGAAIDGEDDELVTQAFINDWLAAVSDNIICLVMAQFVKVEALSARGGEQMAVDIAYLGNIYTAMGLRQHPLLLHLSTILAQDNAMLKSYIESSKAGMLGPAAQALHKLDCIVAAAVLKGRKM